MDVLEFEIMKETDPETRTPGPHIELSENIHEGLLGLLHEYVPAKQLETAHEYVSLLQSQRDFIRRRSVEIGEQAQQFWQEGVAPHIKPQADRYYVPLSILQSLGRKLFLSEADDNEGNFAIGISEEGIQKRRELFDNFTIFDNYERGLLKGFFAHDRHHVFPEDLSRNYMRYLKEKTEKVIDQNNSHSGNKITSTHLQKLRNFVVHYGDIVRFSGFPHDFMAAVVALRKNELVGQVIKRMQEEKQAQLIPLLGADTAYQQQVLSAFQKTQEEKIGEEDIDIARDIFFPTALNLQARFPNVDYGIVVNGTGEAEAKNKIVISFPEGAKIKANFGMIASVFYNLGKNAAKALDWKIGKSIENGSGTPFEAHYQPDKAVDENLYGIEIYFGLNSTDSHTKLTVSDTGTGLMTDHILQAAGRMFTHMQSAQLTLAEAIVGKNTVETVIEWAQGNPFAARSLLLGKVWDLLIIPRLSGFNDFGMGESSGLGLWGINYAIQIKNGVLKAANRFGGGAAFEVSIPHPE